MAVFQAGGVHALTHRAVDEAAGLPQGSTSNRFRTRQALITAVAEEIARLRLERGIAADAPLSLAWLELLLIARRDAEVRDAIAPMRAEMLSRLDAERQDDAPLTTPQIAALLTGLEFAEAVTGVSLDPVALIEGGTTDRPRQMRARRV
ncbi:TetR family transcriptional regulator [Mobilicoccus massiliensis]|uniref:TetR family transcriptional regulator n=1 Tax=Mobilicoccus massiliensis TaxID=1522310 RepID=UPI0006937A7A|nr:TetR family transcriptional regulator [Mobilicoccus massiliensis]